MIAAGTLTALRWKPLSYARDLWQETLADEPTNELESDLADPVTCGAPELLFEMIPLRYAKHRYGNHRRPEIRLKKTTRGDL